MTTNILNVFLSHIHKDDSGLEDFKSLLAKQGIEVRDYSITSDKENNAKSPEYIKNSILAPRIDACSTLVVYLTPETKNSEWVNWEIDYAFKQGKTIVGVWERGSHGCDLPTSLEEHYGAIVGWNSENIIEAINGNYREACNPDGTPMNRTTPINPHRC